MALIYILMALWYKKEVAFTRHHYLVMRVIGKHVSLVNGQVVE